MMRSGEYGLARTSPRQSTSASSRYLPRRVLLVVSLIIFLLSLVPLTSAFRRPMPALAPLVALYQTIAPLRTINGYGLFAVMTKERREILVQGSEDGVTWKPYRFRFKPEDPRRAPGWMAPYMPRLDWQMWFAALGSAEQNPWFFNFLERLLDEPGFRNGFTRGRSRSPGDRLVGFELSAIDTRSPPWRNGSKRATGGTSSLWQSIAGSFLWRADSAW